MKAPTPLTARFVETVTEPGRYGDGRGGHGLTLNVHRMLDGRISRSWIQRIRIGGRVTHLGLGAYPIVTLAEARRAALANRRTVAKGNDPRAGGVPTFADALDKVLDVQRPTWRDGGKSERQWRASLRDYAGPLMSKPVDAKEGPPKTFIGRPDTPLDECLRYTKWHTCDTTHRYDRFKDALRLFDGRDPEEAPKTSIAEALVDIGCGAGLFSWAFIDWAIRGGLTFTKLRKLRLYGLDHCEQYLRLSRDIRELVLGSPPDRPPVLHHRTGAPRSERVLSLSSTPTILRRYRTSVRQTEQSGVRTIITKITKDDIAALAAHRQALQPVSPAVRRDDKQQSVPVTVSTRFFQGTHLSCAERRHIRTTFCPTNWARGYTKT